MDLKYKRILLKMSGEVLAGTGKSGINRERVDSLSAEIADLLSHGIELGLVVGGGNIFRGQAGTLQGVDRVIGDHMGMLATVINSLAVQDSLTKRGIEARVLSAIRMDQFAEPFVRREAVAHLEQGRVVICAGGTGNPFFTTDTAGALRAVEIGADVMLKGTKVDGVYDSDPLKNPQAIRYDKLTYDLALSRDLRVLDAAAFSLARDHALPIVVFDINQRGDLLRIVQGEEVGTLVCAGGSDEC